MAIDFPANPVNEQTYLNYVYDADKGAWRASNIYADTLPAGSIIPWSAANAPPNWLLCDGSAVSRTTYAALFSVIGVLYGNGDGSTTFNLPDLRGRTVVGRDPFDSDFVTLGQSGGAKTHTLTEAQMPNHRHIVDWHNHSQYVTANSGGPAIRRDFSSDGSSWSYWQGQATEGSQPGTSYVGSGQAHNNLQPYEVLNYIIKTTFGTTPEQSQSYDILATYNARLQTLESYLADLQANQIARNVYVQIDTTNRTAGTSYVLGPTFDNLSFKANSKIKMTYHVPMRNDDGSWGGIYIEPQVSFNNGAWQSLGTTGHEMMVLAGGEIMTYRNDILLSPGISTNFTAKFRFYFRSYAGTVGWNNGINHDINSKPVGNATLMSGDNGNQHYMHIIVEEFATGGI